VKLEARRLMDQLVAPQQRCIGAAFCSYTFDAAYFEEQVLRVLLELGGDPQEDGARYHEEARAALQETPVACLIDASVRSGGRRLPYDLHLVRKRTFHPKVMLVLYETEARLAVGSGNLTRAGCESNAELFFVRALPYEDPSSAAMLRSVDGFFEACLELAAGAGTQLAAVRAALAARIARTREPPATARIDAVFVDTFGSSCLDALRAHLPPEAKLRRVGVLAPFFERDDLDIGDGGEGLGSALKELLALRPPEPGGPRAGGQALEVDVAVPWDNAVRAPASPVIPALEEGTRLWAWHRSESEGDGPPSERLRYYTIDKLTPKQVAVRDGAGKVLRLDRREVEAALEAGRFWPIAAPIAHAPAGILRQIFAEVRARLWLYPTATALSAAGQPRPRPLHAKLFTFTVVHRGAVSTYALLGSANASRAALTRTVSEGGNVEAGVMIRFEGEVSLGELAPELIGVAPDGVSFEDRELPARDVDLSTWIDEVVHDAARRELLVRWASDGPPGLEAWRLRYLDRQLAQGTGPEQSPTVVSDFELSSASAELELSAGARRWLLPIRVLDLAQLPVRTTLPAMDLRALLALLGGRMGGERLAVLREQRGDAGVAAILEGMFGEGVGPLDVFKAWWGLRDELERAPTMSSFRRHLLGCTGARAVWTQLGAQPPELLSPDEAWLYGHELVRELRRTELPDGPERAARQALLQELIAEILEALRARSPVAAPWLEAVQAFYDAAAPAGRAAMRARGGA
jgi:hypothetical protein